MDMRCVAPLDWWEELCYCSSDEEEEEEEEEEDTDVYEEEEEEELYKTDLLPSLESFPRMPRA